MGKLCSLVAMFLIPSGELEIVLRLMTLSVEDFFSLYSVKWQNKTLEPKETETEEEKEDDSDGILARLC